jgi:hypothetical protein
MIAAGAGLMMLAPLGGAAPSAQAMTCTAEEPISTACDVGFAVLGTVCTGHLPKVPNLPIATTSATIGWPVDCPPLG